MKLDPPPGGWQRGIWREVMTSCRIIGVSAALSLIAALLAAYRHGMGPHIFQSWARAFLACGVVFLLWTIIAPARTRAGSD